MRADQFLDARGGAVEALGQARDLVAALDVDAGGQVAGAERLDAGLQPLDAAWSGRARPDRRTPRWRCAMAPRNSRRTGMRLRAEERAVGTADGTRTTIQRSSGRRKRPGRAAAAPRMHPAAVRRPRRRRHRPPGHGDRRACRRSNRPTSARSRCAELFDAPAAGPRAARRPAAAPPRRSRRRISSSCTRGELRRPHAPEQRRRSPAPPARLAMKTR